MKILHLGKFYPIRGGVEKVMYDLTLGISNRGIECDMMCTVTNKKTQIIKLNTYGKLICCRSLLKVAATTVSIDMIKLLRKDCNNYDIIHIHHPDPMACLALWLSSYKGRIILHWHSDILKQKTLLRLYSPLQKWLIKKADLIVGTTPVYVKESPFLKTAQHKATYLPIGVDKIIPYDDDVVRLRTEYPDKKIVFSLGRLVEYKGYQYLIDAASYLSDEYIILIAGEGPLKETLQSKIDEKRLEKKVKLLGAISNEERAGYYGLCDVFCLSSVMKTEAFAIVQVEAMSCGKPIVATNIPGSGVSWVNKHSVSGLNVEPGNGKQLANAIEEICSINEVHKQYADNAQLRYFSMFTEEKMIDGCIKIYQNLLQPTI